MFHVFIKTYFTGMIINVEIWSKKKNYLIT